MLRPLTFAGLAALFPLSAAAQQDPMPLSCGAAEEATSGDELTVRCASHPSLAGTHVRLHYREAGREDFRSVPMDTIADGLEGKVPAEAVRPPRLQFYVEAVDVTGQTVMTSGRYGSPHLVVVHPAPASAAVASAPVADAEGSRGPGSFWLGLTLGSGYGWQPATRLEHRGDMRAEAGFAPTALGHLAPEVGYQLAERWAVSIAGRHQFVPGGGGVDERHPGEAPRWAHAVLLRGHHTVASGPWLLWGVAQVGGGDGYRFRFASDSSSGRPQHDTTRAGPLVFGPGAGARYRLHGSVAAVLSLDVLVGAPDLGLITDLALGVQVDL